MTSTTPPNINDASTEPTGLAATRGPRWGILLGGASTIVFVGLAVAIGGNGAIVALGMSAILIGFAAGSALGAGMGVGVIFAAVAIASDSATALGLMAALGFVMLLQLERTTTMRRATQPDDRVGRARLATLGVVLAGSFFIVGVLELVTSDETSSFQLPFGLTITAVVVAALARLLDRAEPASNADAFRPGTRH